MTADSRLGSVETSCRTSVSLCGVPPQCLHRASLCGRCSLGCSCIFFSFHLLRPQDVSVCRVFVPVVLSSVAEGVCSADVELCKLTVCPCAAYRVFEVFALTGLFCTGRLFDFLQVSLPDTLISSDIHNVNPHKRLFLSFHSNLLTFLHRL